MNKEYLLILVNSLNIPKGEYYILGGGSLVICGLKETTADLDLCVSNELFEILKEKYNLSDKDKIECGFYRINDMIEIVPNSKSNFATMEVDGNFIEDLHKIL